MVSINWCAKQKKGIKLTDSNFNISKSYMEMAKNALGTMNREKNFNKTFSISAGYYAMYYALYSLLAKLGVKSEIHKCSILLMDFFDDYSEKDKKYMMRAFELRNMTQYYVDKIIDEKLVVDLYENAPIFVTKTQSMLFSLKDTKIKELRTRMFRT